MDSNIQHDCTYSVPQGPDQGGASGIGDNEDIVVNVSMTLNAGLDHRTECEVLMDALCVRIQSELSNASDESTIASSTSDNFTTNSLSSTVSNMPWPNQGDPLNFANVVFTYFALTNLNLHTKSCEVYSSRTTKD